jgi:hypothetical protein
LCRETLRYEKGSRAIRVEFVARAQVAHRSRKPQQDAQQLYRIAASVQSRARIVDLLRKGVKLSRQKGSLD